MNVQTVAVQSENETPRRDRDKIVLEHLYLVKAVARGIHKQLPVHIELDDLVNTGMLGLLDAAVKYNGQKSVTFQSYAKYRIRGAILDGLRQQDWASRDLRTKQKSIEKSTSNLAATLGRFPNEFEIAQNLSMSIETLRKTQSIVENVTLTSASSEGSNPVDRVAGKRELRPDYMTEVSERRTALAKAVGTLPQRYQRVVTMYYIKNMTLKSIGSEIGVDESRVSQIHASALKKMEVALRATGIHSTAVL